MILKMKSWIVLTLLMAPLVFGRHFLSDKLNRYDIIDNDEINDGDNDNDGDVNKKLLDYVLDALTEEKKDDHGYNINKEENAEDVNDFENDSDYDNTLPDNSNGGGQESDEDYQDSDYNQTPPNSSNGGGEGNDVSELSYHDDIDEIASDGEGRDENTEEVDIEDLGKTEEEEDIPSIDEINSNLFSDHATAGSSPEIIDDKNRLEGLHIGQNAEDYLSQGDIMFTPGEEERVFDLHNSGTSETKRENDATNNKKKYWPGGVVPYVITGPFSATTQKAIIDAIAEYKAKTCIKLIPRTNQKNYVNFKKLKGCWSYVGLRNTGGQDISLGTGCGWKKTVIHEVMHALGFWHEQSRPDRDNYVTINYDNIRDPKLKHNFAKKRKENIDSSGTGYDYYSIMHYSKKAFGKVVGGKKLQTIFPKKALSQPDFGKCSTCGMSETDRKQINTIYKCITPSVTVPSYAILGNIIRGQIFQHRTQSNDLFRKTLLNYLRNKYNNYYWTVSVYKPGGNHWFNGYCGHAFNYYGKNVVACYSRIKGGRYPTGAKQNQIAGAALAAVNGKGCDAKTSVGRARAKALSFGYPIAAVQVVRFGSGLRSQWHAHTKFYNYVCQRTCKKFWWRSSCTNHQSSLIIMFGNP